MQISNRLVLTAFGFLLAAVVAGMVFMQQEEDAMGMWQQATIILLLVAVPFAILIKVLREGESAVAKNQAKNQAVEISTRFWRIEDVSVYEPTVTHWLDCMGWSEIPRPANMPTVGAVLRLWSVDFQSGPQPVVVFDPNHPSIPDLLKLRYVEEVRLDFMESPLPGMSPTTPSAYLVLKKAH